MVTLSLLSHSRGKNKLSLKIKSVPIYLGVFSLLSLPGHGSTFHRLGGCPRLSSRRHLAIKGGFSPSDDGGGESLAEDHKEMGVADGDEL